MKPCLCLIAVLFAGLAVWAGDQQLFNGRDLAGWDGAPGWWRVEDGALTAESTPEKPCLKPNYLVWTGVEPGDFELTADFRLSEQANSGIQIRSERRPDWDTFGYQADMTGDGGLVGFIYHHKRGLIVARGERAALDASAQKTATSLGDATTLLKVFKPGDWNTYRIVCQGRQITLYLNGVLMAEVRDETPDARKDGIVALQMHPGPPMKVQFKNLVLKTPEKGNR